MESPGNLPSVLKEQKRAGSSLRTFSLDRETSDYTVQEIRQER